MIYTIGFIEAYDENFRMNPKVRKLGPKKNFRGTGKNYAGGIAFRTINDAHQYLLKKTKNPKEWGMYGLDGDWTEDVYTHNGENLINKSLPFTSTKPLKINRV